MTFNLTFHENLLTFKTNSNSLIQENIDKNFNSTDQHTKSKLIATDYDWCDKKKVLGSTYDRIIDLEW